MTRRQNWMSGLVCVGLLVPALSATAAQEPVEPVSQATPRPAWSEALRATQASGRPTLLVVTSPRSLECDRLMSTLRTSETITDLSDRVSIAELSERSEPGQVAGLKISKFPTYLLYRRNAEGRLEHAATHAGLLSAEALYGWLLGQNALASEERTHGDDGVQLAGGHAANRMPAPSPQAPYVPPPVVYQAPPQVIYQAPPPAPAPVREVIVERPAPRRVVRERVVERAAPREYVVEREAPVEREVVIERQVEAPREVVREVVVEREAPVEREVVVERVATAPVVEREAEEDAGLVLIEPGPIGRFLGGIGESLRRRALPRVDVDVVSQPVYRFAAPVAAPRVVMSATTKGQLCHKHRKHGCHRCQEAEHAPAQPAPEYYYGPPPAGYTPPPLPPPANSPSPQGR